MTLPKLKKNVTKHHNSHMKRIMAWKQRKLLVGAGGRIEKEEERK